MNKLTTMVTASYCARLTSTLIICASLVASQSLVQIDDSFTYSPSTPNGIQYSPATWDGYNPFYAAQRYNGTYHVTNTVGSNFIFFFRGK
jgi:hypothetical protein